MRILHVANSSYPNAGGIETHVYELAKEQAKDNYVEVFSVGKERRSRVFGGVRMRQFPGFCVLPGTSANFSPWLVLALFHGKWDVIHSHGYFSLFPPFAAIAAKSGGERAVFTVHGYPEPDNRLLAMLRSAYDVLVAPVFLSMADRIITVNPELPRFFARYGKKTVFVPNGVSGIFSHRKLKSRRKGIVYVGRISQDKRVDVILRAMRLGGVGDELRIFGKDCGDLARILAEAGKYGIRVRHAEARYWEMPSIYSACEAVVLPSAYEGFPMVWLESIASGTPVFSARTGAWKEFFLPLFGKDAGRFVFEDEKDLAKKLQFYFKRRKAFARILDRAGKEAVKRYSWKKVARMTMHAYGT